MDDFEEIQPLNVKTKPDVEVGVVSSGRSLSRYLQLLFRPEVLPWFGAVVDSQVRVSFSKSQLKLRVVVDPRGPFTLKEVMTGKQPGGGATSRRIFLRVPVPAHLDPPRGVLGQDAQYVTDRESSTLDVELPASYVRTVPLLAAPKNELSLPPRGKLGEEPLPPRAQAPQRGVVVPMAGDPSPQQSALGQGAKPGGGLVKSGGKK